MLAPDQTVSAFGLPAIEPRAIARRLALPALVGGLALAVVVLAGGSLHRLAQALAHGLGANPGWVAAGAGLEFASLAGYVGLLSLVAGKATRRMRIRESAQITLAGAAATRLLPTAGAGGAGLALWTLRRAGLKPLAAARTLLAFLVLLYAVFLVSIVLAGGALTLGLSGRRGPAALSAIPALAAALCIALALTVALVASGRQGAASTRSSRVGRSMRLLSDAVGDAWQLIRSRDPRLAGAIGYWGFDAAVLWAMLHAFGSSLPLPLIALAYFVGQAANTLPLPGSVSGGIAAVLIAFGVPAAVALPAVLAYRTIAVWLPTPVAIAALPGLRATLARWAREDAAPAQIG